MHLRREVGHTSRCCEWRIRIRVRIPRVVNVIIVWVWVERSLHAEAVEMVRTCTALSVHRALHRDALTGVVANFGRGAKYDSGRAFLEIDPSELNGRSRLRETRNDPTSSSRPRSQLLLKVSMVMFHVTVIICSLQLQCNTMMGSENCETNYCCSIGSTVAMM